MRFFTSLITSLVIALSSAACAAPATGDLASTPPPMSTPTPPRVKPQPVAIDSSCKTSADCAIKDVGNCCGAMPACVNKDSPTDPAAVKAQCQAKGMMGICGFKEISGCRCVNGSCEADAPEGMPAPPVQ
ncbi:MAG TPA: hypothetical protein VIT22_10585 [Pseudoxanthomonas sp.]